MTVQRVYKIQFPFPTVTRKNEIEVKDGELAHFIASSLSRHENAMVRLYINNRMVGYYERGTFFNVINEFEGEYHYEESTSH